MERPICLNFLTVYLEHFLVLILVDENEGFVLGVHQDLALVLEYGLVGAVHKFENCNLAGFDPVFHIDQVLT